MNLFIDTNVFLAFFHYADDDLEELKKLAVVLEKKKATLLLPEQVVDEFRRNRQSKIAQALKALRDQNIAFRFPEFCKHYPQFARLRGLQKQYSQQHHELLEQVTAGIDSQELLADQAIGALFRNAQVLEISPEVLERARERQDRGNPPGKAGSLGDAINWELLLEHAPRGEDIHFITDDRDYASPLPGSAFDAFLGEEWERIKKSHVRFYGTVSAFFREHFPDITLASEAEKDLLIRDLGSSGSFAMTHATIAKLRTYTDFTTAQTHAIVDAALSNSQVGWIVGDPDVREFLTFVIKLKEDEVDPKKLRRLAEALGLELAGEEA